MRLFRLFLKTSPLALFFAVLVGLVAGLFSTYIITQVNNAVAGTATVGFAAFAALVFARFAARMVSTVQLQAMAQRTMYKLRLTLARRLLATPLRKLEELGPAKLLAALTDDVRVLAQAAYAVAVIFTYAGFIVACLAYLAHLSHVFFCFVLLFGLVGSGVNYGLMRYTFEHLLRRARIDADCIFQGFRGLTEGAKELKLHPGRREAFLVEMLEEPADRYRRRQLYGGALLMLGEEWVAATIFLLMGFLALVWPHIASVDHRVVSSFVLTILYLQGAVTAVLEYNTVVTDADVALEKIESIGFSLANQLEPVPPPANGNWHEIELRAVSHTYLSVDDNRQFTLGPINFTLHPSEVVFVVGPNGSGKSTLAKLLVGLYAPEAGEIVADGEVVTDKTRAVYRQRFSAVFSDWFLFDKLFGVDFSNVEAQRYLKELRLQDRVTIDDGRFSTTALSTGQRKRLMLLTAYLEDRPVYLFDEWASDQDPVFKETFYNAILPSLKARGKTVVVITHDDRYFSVADRVIWLADGKVAVEPWIQV